ncbi:MAG: hypothetical protein ABIH23_17840, partial [bacterium]
EDPPRLRRPYTPPSEIGGDSFDSSHNMIMVDSRLSYFSFFSSRKHIWLTSTIWDLFFWFDLDPQVL